MTTPSRFPRDIRPIVVAALIACAGYALFVMRFGDPVRDAQAASSRILDVEKSIPSTVDRAVDKSLQDVKSSNAQLAELDQRIDLLNQEHKRQLAGLEEQLMVLQSRMQRAEALVLYLQQNGGDQFPEGAAPALQDALADVPTSTGQSRQSGQTQIELPPLSNPKIAFKGDFKMEILSARVSRGDLYLDITVTNLKEDAYVAVAAPGAGNGRTRIVSADGIEFSRGSVGMLTGSKSVGVKAASLVEGVPMRFEIKFNGDAHSAVLCKRIDIVMYTDRDHRDKLLFRFEDITATDG